jgi:hypothetical protein
MKSKFQGMAWGVLSLDATLTVSIKGVLMVKQSYLRELSLVDIEASESIRITCDQGT